MFILFQLMAGYLYATWLEWAIHKYISHGLGKNKKSWFNFHWYSHHKSARKNNYRDENYNSFLSPPVFKEIIGLTLLAGIHFPFYYIMPYFFYMLGFCTLRYFYIHQKSHLDPLWAKVYFPWHYDHHMGKNQDANWGVTTPLWDIFLGTREK